MKRTLIRMLGCIMSAVGLGMTYDSTIQILTDDAPGTAFAAETGSGTTGTGTGTCLYATGCYPSVASGIIDSGMSAGTCNIEGEKVGYNVILRPYYVGWPNYKGYGATGVLTDWPAYAASAAASYRDIFYSGDSVGVIVSGSFGAYNGYGIGDVYDPTIGVESPLCTGSYTCTMGGSDCISMGDWGSLHGKCIANAYHIMASNNTMGYYSMAPVYMRDISAFISYGCGVSSSDGTCSSGYKCCYGPADKSYSVTGYYKSQDSSGYYDITVGPLYEPVVAYYFQGCSNGYYRNATMTGTDTNFALSAFAGASSILSENNPSFCPSTDDIAGFISSSDSVEDENGNGYTYVWDTCDVCPTMYAVENYTDVISFSAMDASSDSGVGNTTCNKTVTNAKDVSGTFDFVGTCSYNE